VTTTTATAEAAAAAVAVMTMEVAVALWRVGIAPRLLLPPLISQLFSFLHVLT